MMPVDKAISRKKHNKPKINPNIANTNSVETTLERSILKATAINRVAINKQMHSADKVQRLIDKWSQRALLERMGDSS